MPRDYDVIVIGGGHAGAEAAWAASHALGNSGRVAMITMDPSKIGAMSCNPAIGGLAKGQIVREVDALGGLMGRAADATGIMFKMLNMSKGPAVRGPRAQCDKYAYAAEVQRLLSTDSSIVVIAATIDEITSADEGLTVVLSANAQPATANQEAIDWNQQNAGMPRPVFTVNEQCERRSRRLSAGSVVLTTGTFMRALMHTGPTTAPGGRVGEGSAVGISHHLRGLGFELGRLKTGTPPRLARESIAWESLPPQEGDEIPTPFSDVAHQRFPRLRQVECRVTSTTTEIHQLIRENLHRAPMYSGQIEAECGPRYCPSIEDKVVRFAEKQTHHVFLEPESLHTNEIYCNGISTSLPADVQEMLVRGMAGCADAVILRHGYAVEYDMVWPHQIDSTCMTKLVPGLFLAGQINGTSGYEEAAGQGLVAGLNAARFARGEDPVRLGRDQAYIGVMLDDLVTKTPREPYRMFTSRAEHRLLLRADNADERLTPLGRSLGLVGDDRWQAFQTRRDQIIAIRESLQRRAAGGKRLAEVARRPEVDVSEIAASIDDAVPRPLLERVVTDLRYEGYVDRQRAEIRRQQESEQVLIPADMPIRSITGLRSEAIHVLSKFRPATLGQAARLAGINPADLSLIAIAIRRFSRSGHAAAGPNSVTNAPRLRESV